LFFFSQLLTGLIMTCTAIETIKSVPEEFEQLNIQTPPAHDYPLVKAGTDQGLTMNNINWKQFYRCSAGCDTGRWASTGQLARSFSSNKSVRDCLGAGHPGIPVRVRGILKSQ
jgi:hypothetical protein